MEGYLAIFHQDNMYCLSTCDMAFFDIKNPPDSFDLYRVILDRLEKPIEKFHVTTITLQTQSIDPPRDNIKQPSRRIKYKLDDGKIEILSIFKWQKKTNTWKNSQTFIDCHFTSN